MRNRFICTSRPRERLRRLLPLCSYITSSYADGTLALGSAAWLKAHGPAVLAHSWEEPSMADRVPLGQVLYESLGEGRVELQPLPKDVLTPVGAGGYQEWYPLFVFTFLV